MSLQISVERDQNHFDLIRQILAILVIVSHAFVLSGHESNYFFSLFRTITPADASFRVNMFFVMSGFFVTHSIHHANSYKNFFLCRLLRIYPGLMVVVFFSMFVIGPAFTTLSLKDYFSSFMLWDYLRSFSLYSMRYYLPGLFESNPFPGINGSLWVLRYEFTGYIGLFLLSISGMLRKKTVVVVLFILCVTISGIDFIPDTISILTLNIYLTIKLAAYFLAGILIYLYQKEIRLTLLGAALALVFTLIGYFYPAYNFIHFVTLPYLLFVVAYIPSRYHYSTDRHGDYSVGLYLYSFPIMEALIFVFNNTINIYLFITLSISISFLLAYCSWHFIEKKALRYKNHLK